VDIPLIKKELIAAAKRFYEAKFQTGNGGNLSARVPQKDCMIVKATDVSFGELDESSLVVCDFDGNVIEGTQKPSKESLLHGALYKKAPWCQAIMHCHSPWAVGWAARNSELEFATYHAGLKLKAPVRVFDTKSYAVPPECFARILSLFDEYPESRAFLLKGHGQVALGKDVRDAAFNAELVEETAQIAVIGKMLLNTV
jgi:L-ribulose-5-phosphate 4-epimerase